VTDANRNAILKSPEKFGLPPEQVTSFIQDHGASPEVKQRLTSGVRQGNRETIATVETLASSGNFGLDELQGEEAKVLYWVGKDTTSDAEFTERREAVTEGLRANDGKVLGFFARQWNRGQLSGLDEEGRGQIGQRGMRDKLAKTWNDMSAEQAEFLGFEDKPDFKDLAEGTVIKFGRFLDIAALSMMNSPDASIDNITARAISMMKGQYESARTTDGERRVVPRVTPRVTKDPLGQTVNVKPFAKDEMDEIDEYFKDDHTRPLAKQGFGGVRPDRLTQFGKGLAVTHAPNQLGPRPFVLPISTFQNPTVVTREYFDAYLSNMVGENSPFRVVQDMGERGVTLEITPPVGDDATEVVFDANMSLLYDFETRQWTKRWKPSGAFKDTGIKEMFGNMLRAAGIGPKILDKPMFDVETIPEASRKRLNRRVEKTVPLFWTDERLQGFVRANPRPGPLMDKVQSEIKRRAMGGQPADIEEFIRNKGRVQ
jgi:hypothetical protein